MGSNVINWHAKAGRSVGIGAIDYTPARVGQTLHIPCSRGHRVDVELKERCQPEMLGKKLLRAGWTIGNHLLCPKHSKKPKAPEAPQQETNDMPAVEAVKMPPLMTVQPSIITRDSSDAARTAKRAAMQWLDEAFDVAKGTYSPGVTDETIAKETGLAAAKVKELREEFYGALKVPSDIDELKREMAGFYAQLEQLNADHSARHEALVAAANATDARIEAIVQRNGWRA